MMMINNKNIIKSNNMMSMNAVGIPPATQYPLQNQNPAAAGAAYSGVAFSRALAKVAFSEAVAGAAVKIPETAAAETMATMVDMNKEEEV